MDKEIIKKVLKELLWNILNKDIRELERFIETTRILYKDSRGIEEKQAVDRIKAGEEKISLVKDKYKRIDDLINQL